MGNGMTVLLAALIVAAAMTAMHVYIRGRKWRFVTVRMRSTGIEQRYWISTKR